MKAVCLFLLVGLLLGAFVAPPVEGGFGCPLFQGRCHAHCKSTGHRGGYCGNDFKLTCICYR